jgi:hypothetical protein
LSSATEEKNLPFASPCLEDTSSTHRLLPPELIKSRFVQS